LNFVFTTTSTKKTITTTTTTTTKQHHQQYQQTFSTFLPDHLYNKNQFFTKKPFPKKLNLNFLKVFSYDDVLDASDDAVEAVVNLAVVECDLKSD
jgi:hypothetical protein